MFKESTAVTIDTGTYYLELQVTYCLTPYRIPTDRGTVEGNQIEDIKLDGPGLGPVLVAGYWLKNRYAEFEVSENDEALVAEFREFVEEILGDNINEAAEEIADQLASQHPEPALAG